MKKIVIAGGSGFIGTNLVQYYLDRGWEVINLDCSPPRNSAHSDCFRQVNLLDASELVQAVKSFAPDYLVHLAARTDLNEKYDIQGYAANIQGIPNIITACNNCENIKRVIFTSSMLVCRFGYAPKNENDYTPNTLYGESKVLTEKAIRQSNIRPEWLIIRPTSIWGPWFDVPYKNFFNVVLNGKFFHPGHRAGTATYGYVGNSAYQIDQLLMAKKENIQGRIFYIGDSPPNNLSEWADEIAAIAGLKKLVTIPYFIVRTVALLGDFLTIVKFPFPLTSFRLMNMTTDNIIDISATEAIVGQSPFSRLAAIQETLKWMRNEG